MNFGNSNPLAGIPVVTKNILIVTVLVFLAQLAWPQFSEFFTLFHWRSELFKPHQLISYMFLHDTSGFSHILFNMFGLYVFGRVLESIMGPKKFLTFYLLTGIGSALIQMIAVEIQFQLIIQNLSTSALEYINSDGISLLNGAKGPIQFTQDLNFVDALILVNSAMVGASGAIFGILVAFGYLFPNAQLMLLFPPIPIKGKYIAVFALVMGIVLDFSGNVAHFAHFGGMLTGFILLKLWRVKSNSFR